MAAWERVRMMLLFALLLPLGSIFLALAVAEGDGEALFVGAEWIKASLKNIKGRVFAARVDQSSSTGV